MKIIRNDGPSGVVLELKGAMIGKSVPEFARVVRELFDQGCARLALDMSAVPLVDSDALELLLHCHEQCTAHGGACELINVSPEVSKILRFTRLDRELITA